jgi:hypothetical protein
MPRDEMTMSRVLTTAPEKPPTAENARTSNALTDVLSLSLYFSEQ